MRIGIASPITISELRPWLDEESQKRAKNIKGLLAPSVDTLVIGLLDAGHEVVVFTTDLSVKETIYLNGKKLKIYICKHRQCGHLRALTFFSSEVRKMSKCMRQEKLDILHAHWTYEFAMAALRTKHKVCITIRDIAPYIFKLHHNFYRLIRLIINQYVFSKRNRVQFIANSKYVHDEVLRSDQLSTVIIPNPVTLSFARATDHVIKTNSNNRIISISNGWSEFKNINNLIEAFQIIRHKIPNAELWLVGNNFTPKHPMVNKLKQKDPEIFKGVKLCGHIEHDRLIDLFAGCDILIHPSLHESFGNILLEAMSQQVPVLGGEKSGAVPWVLNYGKTGMLCDVTSAQDIADKAIDLLTDKKKWEHYSRAGYQHVIDNYTADKITEKTVTIYKKFIDDKSIMKVLHILNELKYSGAETMLSSAARVWNKNSVELHVLSTGQKSGAYSDTLKTSGYILHHIPFQKNFKFIKRIKQLCVNEKYDIVHIHPEGIYLQCALATFWARIPAIRTVHHIFSYKNWRYYRTILMRHFCRSFLKIKFVSNSYSGKNNELKMYHMNNEYIPNWFNSDIYNADAVNNANSQRQEIRKELGADDKSIILISLGGNWEYKNYNKVIKAISKMPAPERFIYVHCGGDETGELNKLAKNLNVKYIGMGFVADVIPYLVAADLFMQPSREEGFCIAAVEAMATGIPVCLSTRPALCDFKKYCDEILWCEPSIESIVEVLANFQKMTDKQKIQISKGVIEASHNFCIERGAMAYYNLYEKVLKK